MALDILVLIAGLALILLAAEFFTNGVEHLGERLNLGEAAVGSVLAAVGTAMPETLIPVVAILSGGGADGHSIGIGAILGAPFMLSTLAFAVTALAALSYVRRRESGIKLAVDRATVSRDLLFFLVLYAVAVLASWVPAGPGRWLICLILLLGYGYYVWINLRSGGTLPGEKKPLRLHAVLVHLSLTRLPEETMESFLHRRHMSKCDTPHLIATVAQTVIALGIMLLGARLFVSHIEHLSLALGVSGMIIALIIAPIATELPEKFNSVIWIKDSKDTMALGNITGAMVFQSSIPATLGIALTDWRLHNASGHGHAPLFSVGIAMLSALIVLIYVRRRRHAVSANNRSLISPWVLLIGLPLYLLFIISILLQW